MPVVLLSVFAGLSCAAPAPVKVWPDSIVLPTYIEDQPDPNPDFSVFRENDMPNYPYPLRNRFGEKRKDQTWRTLNLENDYLVCRVLPDLGGHLYNCRDKIANREVFYANPVVKKGKEGLRGSFVAMGIESNFPAGHSRTGTSPIDFAYRQNDDGSGSVIVGNVDRITGMQWRAEYVLRPGAAILEQHVTLYNRSDASRRYYWWANAAIEYDDKKTRAVFPAYIMQVHETNDLVPWPVGADGVDGSIVANHRRMNGYFSYGCREPFMAIYKPGSRSGVAHYANDGVKGKKLWIWGAEGDDMVRAELTDRFNSYIEMQGGLFQSQRIFEYLQPQEVREFIEYWIPFRDMSGVSRATPEAVILLDREKTNGGKTFLTVQANVTRPQPGAKAEVICGAKRVLEITQDLDPAKPFDKRVEADAASPCTLRISSSRGTTLIEHTEGLYNSDSSSSLKLGALPQLDWAGEQTEALLLRRAEYYEADGRLHLAWQDYNLALEKNPKSAGLRRHLARVAIALLRPEDAVIHGSAALAANPADEEAAYYVGVADGLLGRDTDALAVLGKVKPGSPFYYAALLQTALAQSRSGNFKAAVESAGRAAKDESARSRIGAIEVALLRRAGQKEAAISRVAHWLALDPADPVLRFERFLLEGKDDGLWTHLAGDPERILNIADEYIALGAFDSALAVLSREYPAVPPNQVELGSPPPAHHALIAYYRAWCRGKTGADAAEDWNAAAALSPRYMFPSRFTSYAVLNAAVHRNASDALAHYLLGLLNMTALRTGEAISEWQQAMEINPRLEGLHRNLGRALLTVKNDPAAAQSVLKAGARIDKQNADITALLEQASTALKAKPGKSAARAEAVQAALSEPAQQAVAAMLKAASGSVDDALAIFAGQKLANAEQSTEIGQAYLEVQLQRTLSLARVAKCDAALQGLESLGDNAPHSAAKLMKYPHFQYYMGLVEEKCGREKEARKRWGRISPSRERLPGAETVYPYLASIRLDPDLAKADVISALHAVEAELAKPENAPHAWLLFAKGVLLSATGKQADGMAVLKRAASIPTDPLAQYLSVVELNLNAGLGK